MLSYEYYVAVHTNVRVRTRRFVTMREGSRLLITLMALAVLFIDPGSAHAVVSVPEPSTLALLTSGVVLLGGIALLRRRK